MEDIRVRLSMLWLFATLNYTMQMCSSALTSWGRVKELQLFSIFPGSVVSNSQY